MQCASIYGESTGEERYVLTCFLPFNNPSRTSFLTCFNYQYQGVWSAAFSPNGQYFAFVDSGGFVSLHEGERPFRQKWSHKSHVSRTFSLGWSHDSTMVVTAGLEDKIVVADVASGGACMRARACVCVCFVIR